MVRLKNGVHILYSTKKPVVILKTSRPEARDGQRYPCPAHQHCSSSLEVGRAVAPKGTISCRIQGKSVHTSISLSICPSIHPSRALQWLAGWGGGINGQMDGRMYRFPLYSTGHHPLWGRCPKMDESLSSFHTLHMSCWLFSCLIVMKIKLLISQFSYRIKQM